MREILFRGKSVESDEWVFGSFIPDLLEVFYGDTNLDGFIKPFSKEKEKRMQVEVLRETVGQYTGLTDKMGKKIFEGDICEFHNKGIGNSKYEIMWFVSKWVVRHIDNNMVDELDLFFTEHSKIIGNIYDNPNFLKGE